MPEKLSDGRVEGGFFMLSTVQLKVPVVPLILKNLTIMDRPEIEHDT